MLGAPSLRTVHVHGFMLLLLQVHADAAVADVAKPCISTPAGTCTRWMLHIVLSVLYSPRYCAMHTPCSVSMPGS